MRGLLSAARRERLLGLIAHHAGAATPAPTYDEIADHLGTNVGSNAQISATIAWFAAEGMIRIERRGAASRYFHVASGRWTAWSEPRKGRIEGATRKCITCRKPFRPEHKGNYICTGCTKLANNASPYATGGWLHSNGRVG